MKSIELDNFGGGKLGKKERMVLEAMEKTVKPFRPRDVVKTVGLGKGEVSKIMRTLKKKGKIASPKRCIYAPAK